MKTLFLSIFFIFTSFSFSSEYDVKELVKMKGQLFQNAGSNYLAITLKNAEKWHTYWKNPGDAGIPPQFKFLSNGEEIKLNQLEWPAPKKYIEQGDIWAFGYSDFYTFFFELPKDKFAKLKAFPVTVEGKWLVCKEICIPGEDEIMLRFEDTKIISSPSHFDYSNKKLASDFDKLPKEITAPDSLNVYLNQDSSGQLFLYYSIAKSKAQGLTEKTNLLFPFPYELFDYKHEKLLQDSENFYGVMQVDWNGEYLDTPREIPSNGKFSESLDLKFLIKNPNNNHMDIVTWKISSFSKDQQDTVKDFYSKLRPLDADNSSSAPISRDNKSLWFYLLFAFIGGFILNFMPCVLPVISLKLFSLIKYKDSSRTKLLKHNLAYTAGILFSFLLLAITVVAIKSSGEFVGWGFQLQSPIFVALMVIMLFVFSLNLFGLFEFITPGGRSLGGIQLKEENFVSDFFSGVLATILSTPCSAPFLGTALTFAFTSSNFFIFLIFLMIGLGLATPFILTAIFPATLVMLPRPGDWMESLKKFLGLTLLLTIAWLYDVFLSLVDGTYFVLLLNLTLITTFFAIYFHKRIGKNKFLKLLFFFLPVAIFLSLLNHQEPNTGTGPTAKVQVGPGLNWRPWSEQSMRDLKGETVFIDFTAKWCFTCKVNEKVVLDTDSFRDLVAERNLKLLLGDWTKRDPIIGEWLKKNGSVGVPAYFIQKPDGTLVRLGETITLDKIIKNL